MNAHLYDSDWDYMEALERRQPEWDGEPPLFPEADDDEAAARWHDEREQTLERGHYG